MYDIENGKYNHVKTISKQTHAISSFPPKLGKNQSLASSLEKLSFNIP
jgi:hypothetical protein